MIPSTFLTFSPCNLTASASALMALDYSVSKSVFIPSNKAMTLANPSWLT
jgi:hypothetical protein